MRVFFPCEYPWEKINIYPLHFSIIFICYLNALVFTGISCFFYVLSNCEFPENLKLADVTPVFKKKRPFRQNENRPVSALPPVSKIFERLMQKQIN